MTGVASIHYTEYRVKLSSVERFFNQPELPLEGRIIVQPQTKTANGDADRVMVSTTQERSKLFQREPGTGSAKEKRSFPGAAAASVQ